MCPVSQNILNVISVWTTASCAIIKKKRKELPVAVSRLSPHLPFRFTPSSEEATHRVPARWVTVSGHEVKNLCIFPHLPTIAEKL